MADQVASNPKLIEGCKLWDKITTDLMMAKGKILEARGEIDLRDLRPEGSEIYTRQDYAPLACRIDGDKAEVTVGSSPGHAVHVSADVGYIKYYDIDRAVNEIMKDLFEKEANVRCTVFEGGVECEGLKPEKAIDLFRVMAMPTSMDMRHEFCRYVKGNPHEYCVEREKGLFEQIKKAFK